VVSVKIKSDSSGSSSSSSTVSANDGSGLKVTSPEKNKITLTWTKVSKCDGYEDQFSYAKDFSSLTNAISYGKDNNKAVFTQINSNKYVYCRVRTFTYNGTQTEYGSWSKTVKIKVK
jgi:hypothetical protein